MKDVRSGKTHGTAVPSVVNITNVWDFQSQNLASTLIITSTAGKHLQQ